MKINITFPFVLSIAIVSFFVSCNKKETVEVDNETQSSVDNAIAEQEYMAVIPAVQSHAINTKGTGAQGGKSANTRCDTLTLISGDTLWGTPGHIDPTYTMNISNNACAQTLADGRFRQGLLSVRLTGKVRTPGSKMIIKMINYRAALVSYKCDSIVVTTVEAGSNFNKFNVRLVNGICQTNNWVIRYSFDRTTTFYPQGNSSSDPVTYIYGTASGTNRQGRNFSMSIPEISPLVKYSSCEYISSGIMLLTPDGFATRTIDYGYSISPAVYGGCDEDASFTVNGNTVAFKLK